MIPRNSHCLLIRSQLWNSNRNPRLPKSAQDCRRQLSKIRGTIAKHPSLQGMLQRKQGQFPSRFEASSHTHTADQGKKKQHILLLAEHAHSPAITPDALYRSPFSVLSVCLSFSLLERPISSFQNATASAALLKLTHAQSRPVFAFTPTHNKTSNWFLFVGMCVWIVCVCGRG